MPVAESLLLLLLAVTARAAPIEPGCTDLGSLSVHEPGDSTGYLRGGQLPVEVRGEELIVRREERIFWSGPLSALAFQPFAKQRRPSSSRAAPVLDHLRRAGSDPDCLWGGRTRFRLPPWSEPIPLEKGARLSWVSRDQALVVGPGEKRSWYLALSVSESGAGELRQALEETGLSAIVSWLPGVALARASTTPLEGGIPPLASPRSLGWRRLAAEARTIGLPTPPSSVPDPLLAGWEMVARLNQERRGSGLDPVEWDEGLAWSALSHCIYMDWTQTRQGGHHGHDQRPEVPVFTGRTPRDRGGSWEVIHQDFDAPPAASIEVWLQAPLHRRAPIDPRATRAGACATPGGARVMELSIDPPPSPTETAWIHPPHLSTDVPLSFTGLEDPDPLVDFPERMLPVGYPLSAWFEGISAETRVVETTLLDAGGEAVPHYVVRRDLDRAVSGRGAVHLVPKEPLVPLAGYRWSITLSSPLRKAEGRFITGRGPVTPVSDGAGPFSAVLERENRRRATRGLMPFVHVHELDAVAASYLAGQAWTFVPKLVPGSQWVSCVSVKGLLSGQEPELQFREPPAGAIEYRYVGHAREGGRMCMTASTDPLAPRPP